MVPATGYYRVVVFGGVSVALSAESHCDAATLLNTLKCHGKFKFYGMLGRVDRTVTNFVDTEEETPLFL